MDVNWFNLNFGQAGHSSSKPALLFKVQSLQLYCEIPVWAQQHSWSPFPDLNLPAACQPGFSACWLAHCSDSLVSVESASKEALVNCFHILLLFLIAFHFLYILSGHNHSHCFSSLEKQIRRKWIGEGFYCHWFMIPLFFVFEDLWDGPIKAINKCSLIISFISDSNLS